MTEFELLDLLRIRTGMYTGRSTPSHLESFINGYYFSTDITTSDLIGFNDWIAEKLGFRESTAGWANMIEDQRIDPKEALYLFYELLDQYRNISHILVATCTNFDLKDIDKTWRGYSRKKRYMGSNNTLEKPDPSLFQIRQLSIPAGYYQLLAVNSQEEILDLLSADNLETIYVQAERKYGISKVQWQPEK